MEKDFIITGIKRVVFVGEYEYPENKTSFNMPSVQNELIFNFSGRSAVFFNGKELLNLPDTIRFLPCGEVFQYDVIREKCGSCIDIVFTADRPLSAEAFVTAEIKNNKLPALFKKIFSVWVAKNEGYKFECISLLYKIFAEMQKETYLPEKDYKKIEPAISYINEGFLNKDISAEKLSSLCGVSYSYLKKLFVKRLGLPPKKYIIQLKINYACDLLKSEMYSVSQVAELCGYGDLYFFSRQFKEYMGISPTEYKNKYKSSK